MDQGIIRVHPCSSVSPMTESLSDAERFPLLTEPGRRMLQWLREHPHAPRYTAQSGNRLTAESPAGGANVSYSNDDNGNRSRKTQVARGRRPETG